MENGLLALIVSCLTFAAFHTISCIAYMPDMLFFGFFAPILMHRIYNLALIQNMV